MSPSAARTWKENDFRPGKRESRYPKNGWLSEVKWLEELSIKAREGQVSWEQIEKRREVKKDGRREKMATSEQEGLRGLLIAIGWVEVWTSPTS